MGSKCFFVSPGKGNSEKLWGKNQNRGVVDTKSTIPPHWIHFNDHILILLTQKGLREIVPHANAQCLWILTKFHTIKEFTKLRIPPNKNKTQHKTHTNAIT